MFGRMIKILLITVFIFIGCGGEKPGDDTAGPVVTDLAGRKVRVPEKVERIVCKGPGALRLITYLRATDMVVGIEGGFETRSARGRPYRLTHRELDDLPRIGAAGPSAAADAEAVLSVRPDVIFISYADRRVVENLQNTTGIPVVVLSQGPLGVFDADAVFESLKLAAKILGKQHRARQVIKFVKDTQRELRERVEGTSREKGPSVYVGALGYKGSRGITSTQTDYPGFELLEANVVTDELSRGGHVSVSKEKLLQWDPDVIFIDGGGLEVVRQDCRRRPEFYRSLSAVRNGSVHVLLPYNFYATNVSTALANYYYIGKVLYPRRFADVDPARRADAIYSFLVGAPVFKRMKRDYGGFAEIDLMECRSGGN